MGDREEPSEREHATAGSGGDLPENEPGDLHWSRARAGMNEEALAYYRERSKAPGMEDAGPRNAYCMNCDGVIPIQYDSTKPADRTERRCPHCGSVLDARLQRMFNWVEIDQVPEGDARAVLPLFFAALVLLALLVWILWR